MSILDPSQAFTEAALAAGGTTEAVNLPVVIPVVQNMASRRRPQVASCTGSPHDER